jgi:phosphoribosyl-ATP pyrophosphohydrolase/phosphoribosyl-AMP cyclohydrolase
LFESGAARIAQKVGEEGVEVALAAVTADDAQLIGEAADLVYHLAVLLRARGLS